jgi:predicted transcriptional regulator
MMYDSLMTRLTISVPDQLAEQISQAADGNVSAWMAEAAREKVLREECAALATWEATNRDSDWDAERWGE